MTHWKIGDLFGRSRQSPKTSADSRHEHPRLLTEEVHASAHDGGLVLLHVPSGRMYNCNRTGARIWKGLAGGLDPNGISREISRDYGVEEAVVQAHTSLFVGELERRGFVTRMAGCR